MLLSMTVLLAFQLVGEAIARGSAFGIPGPVIGLALLAASLAALPDIRRAMEPTASGLLGHLSLLFVPAAVGVVQQLPRLRSEGLAISCALVISTVASMVVTAIAFQAVSRRMGITDER